MNGSGSDSYFQSYRLFPIGNASAAGMWTKRSQRLSFRPASRTSTVVRRIGAEPVRERAAGRAAADDHEVVGHERTTVCSSVNVSIGAVPPTRPMPLAVPERPPNGRWLSQ